MEQPSTPEGRRTRPVPTLVRLAWRADRRGVLVIVAAALFDAAAALGATATLMLLLNSITRSAARGTNVLAGAWWALGAVAAIFVVQRVLFPFLAPAEVALEYRLAVLVQQKVMAPLMRPATISHLEDPSLADELRLATLVGSENFSAQQALDSLTGLMTTRLTAFAGGVWLGFWRWWAPLVLLAAWLASRRWYRGQMASLVNSMERNTPPLRRSEYVSDMILSGKAAKETRIFGVDGWLVTRFQTQWKEGMTEVWRQRRRGRLSTVASVAVLFGANFAVLALLIRGAINGEFTHGGVLDIGNLFLYLTFAMGMAGFGYNPEAEYVLHMGTAPLPHVAVLDERIAAHEATSGTAPAAPARPVPSGAPEHGIAFCDVTFAYPRTGRPVLDHLDLEIGAGTSLAVVGENGEGKTTLVNLLCGFYPVSSGRILIDGVDLATLDPRAWQRQVAAVFQEFARYPVTLGENVAFGNPQRAGDRAARARAAERAGIGALVEALPAGWDTTVTREFDDGTDLSGGQWQKVALARAMFALECGATVLVLDEPTANLDVRAEAALYDRFLELTAGRTTIVVSHRFSTVRRADRIVVLGGGRIVESGTHDELMAAGGRYAAMFTVQASAFEAPAGAPTGPAGAGGPRRGGGRGQRTGQPGGRAAR